MEVGRKFARLSDLLNIIFPTALSLARKDPGRWLWENLFISLGTPDISGEYSS
jgi:hypothetical protein